MPIIHNSPPAIIQKMLKITEKLNTSDGTAAKLAVKCR
jgi:hypothetical protein